MATFELFLNVSRDKSLTHYAMNRIGENTEEVRQKNRCIDSLAFHSKGVATTLLRHGFALQAGERVRGDARTSLPQERKTRFNRSKECGELIHEKHNISTAGIEGNP